MSWLFRLLTRLFTLLTRLFAPPNTVESVLHEIVEGVENGTVIIPGLEDDSDDDHDQQGD
jgi:hypothetical protein